MVAVLSSGDLLRGLLSGFFGLMFTMVGLAPIDGTIRFTFGNVNMMAGFDTLSTLIGIFAISEILITSEQKDKGEQVQLIQMEEEGHGILGRILGLSWAEFKYQIPNAFRSALIGLGIGILPGIGGSTSGMLSYVMAKKHQNILKSLVRDAQMGLLLRKRQITRLLAGPSFRSLS